MALGAGLFDSPVATFVVEMLIFGAGYLVYTVFAPEFSLRGLKNSPNLSKMIFAFMVVQQGIFCFGS